MKKIYILLGALLSAGCIQAQSPQMNATYDFHPNEKYSPGAITVIPMRDVEVDQNRAVHYTENFDAGFGIWTAAVQAGPAQFALTNTGHANNTGNTFIIPTLMTSTPTQWVLLDSDAAPGAAYTNPEAATLTSGLIDLSGAIDISAGDFVAFEFDQFFAEWQPAETADHLYLGVSSDGTNFTEIEISEGAGRDARPNPERVSWDISDEIDGTENSIYLRFRWEGAWNYGWQIDNVEIVDIPEKDIAIVDTWRAYSNSGLTYSKVPVAHTDTLDIVAIIRNIGHIDQTGVTFDYVVKDPTNATVASGTAGTTLTLQNAEQDTILWSTNYVPTMLGNYTVEWTAVSLDGDDNLTNNDVTDAFYELTDFTYATDYNEGPVEPIDNWPLMTGEAYFGSLFDFVASDEVSGIDFKLTSNTVNVGEEILASIWYNDGTQWLEGWALSTPYTVTASDIGNWVSIPVTQGGGGYAVNNSDLYLIMIGQYATPSQPMFERQGEIPRSIIQGINEDGGNVGFFDRKAPLVRARINAAEVGIEDVVAEDKFVIYPNPANEAINISIALTNSESTVVNVVDITGKVITTMNLGTVNGEKNFSVSLTDLSTGVYFVEMVNADSKQVKKFVKK